MPDQLIVSETIYGLHEEYRYTVGEPLEVTTSEYAFSNEVALFDTDAVVIVPVMYTLPVEDEA